MPISFLIGRMLHLHIWILYVCVACTPWYLSVVSSGPESSPAGSPAPACSQQQVIQHNTITTSTATVGGSSVHGQANHRTDINPIH